MSILYSIKGVISVSVYSVVKESVDSDEKLSEGLNYTIKMIPASGYLSPDSKFGIAFQISDTIKSDVKNGPSAKLLTLQDKYCTIPVNGEYLSFIKLLLPWINNKEKIELTLDEETNIVGFLFPVL
jgi:hypothetical protein